MGTNRFAATFVVAVFLLGVPVAVALRLSGGLQPLQPIDVVLAIGIIGWFHFVKAMLERDQAIDSTRLHPTSLRWQAHALVAASLFGAASSVATAPAPLAIGRLCAPGDDITGQLPPPILTSVEGGGLIIDSDRPAAAQPVLGTDNGDDLPPILATETYVVARGDTFWSIAEVTLGEGRFWTAIRDLNLGREVAPGIELALDQDLRIGWSVLIPLVADETEASVQG